MVVPNSLDDVVGYLVSTTYLCRQVCNRRVVYSFPLSIWAPEPRLARLGGPDRLVRLTSRGTERTPVRWSTPFLCGQSCRLCSQMHE
jgi:hypothetical protein